MAKFDPGHSTWPDQSVASVDSFELVSFYAEPKSGQGIDLHWGTRAEVPGCAFTIERSADRMNWFPAFTQAGEGGSEEFMAYAVMDLAPINGISYYRMSATAQGRLLEVSDEFEVDYAPDPAMQFSFDPTSGKFRVEGLGAISDLQVLNNRGQFIPMDLTYDQGQVVMNTMGLEPGTYFVQAVVNGTPVLRAVVVTASGIIAG